MHVQSLSSNRQAFLRQTLIFSISHLSIQNLIIWYNVKFDVFYRLIIDSRKPANNASFEGMADRNFGHHHIDRFIKAETEGKMLDWKQDFGSSFRFGSDRKDTV
jgi:hypothetical protein